MNNTLRVTGGRVLRPDGRVTESDVTIDRDAGTIVAVGDETVSDAEAGSDAEVASDGETLDASGSLVIPGLVNAHTHVAMTLLRGYADDKPLDPWLREDIWPAEAELTPDDIEAGAELGVVEMIPVGDDVRADMYFAMDRVADVVDRAGLRARLGHGVVTIGKGRRGRSRRRRGESRGRSRTRRRRRRADPDRLHAALADDGGREYLHEGVAEAREAGVPIHLHANETEDEVDPIVDERGERPIAYAQDLDALGPDDFFAHGVHLDGSEIDQIADAGTAIVHRPASNMKLASGMAPSSGSATRARARSRSAPMGRPRTTTSMCSTRCATPPCSGSSLRTTPPRCPPRRSWRWRRPAVQTLSASPAVGSSRARPPTSPSLTSTPRT